LVLNTYYPELTSREEKFNFLTTLREVTEGKMMLEREYSQVTKSLVEMYEADGKIDEACKIIQEIQIETYGSLKNKEKVDFILYQMKLVLQRQDYIRLLFLSKKINRKMMDEPGLEASKILYYKFLVRYYVQEKELLNASKAYQTIYDSLAKAQQSDEKLIAALDGNGADRKMSFQNFTLYLIVSSFSQEKSDLLSSIEEKYARELDTEPVIAKFIRKMLTFELYPMDEREIEQQLAAFEPFQDSTKNSK
jgi:26S proteasome regulatory subunit N5